MKKKIEIVLLSILLLSIVGCVGNSKEENIIDADMSYYADGIITEKSYKEIESRFGLFPSSIYIDDDYTKIGWVYEGGTFLCSCENDKNQPFLFDDKGQEFHYYDDSLDVMNESYASLYFGELEKVTDNVYSVRGEFCPYYENLNRDITVVDDIDFYLVFDDEKMFVIFEKVTSGELDAAKFDSYFIKMGEY